MDAAILERDDALAQLAEAVRAAGHGQGSLVLVSGEPGIGKSRLIAELPRLVPPGGRVLVGWCDDLASPRVLGPLRDLIGRAGPALDATLRGVDRSAVIDALRAELTTGASPTVLVIEDAHWADEATLDVLSHLARRLDGIPVVVVLTYRDEDLPTDHPLRRLIGLAARVTTARRIRLARLTPAGVRTLCAGSSVDPDRLFGVTMGNPYFVSEVLATGDADSVPLTIADAVQARLARLNAAALEAVTALAVVPSAVDQWLVDALVPDGLAGVADAERCGLLVVGRGRVAFRHELTRRAVLHTMPAAGRIAAERCVLDVLLASAPADPSRIVHHARGAGDRDALLAYGPLAAREAIAAGAHRQAVAHLRAVLDEGPSLEAADEAELWQSLAVEIYTVDAPSTEAVTAQQRAVALRRTADPRALGAALRWLSRICWWAGDPESAAAAADEARVVLAGVGDTDLLAMAISNQAQLHALAGRDDAAITLCTEGLRLAGISAGTRSHLLNNLGFAKVRTRQPEGHLALAESLAIALDAHEPEHACRAYVNIAWHELEELELDAAEAHTIAGLALAERTEFLTFARYLQLLLGMVRFAAGRWDEVVPAAAFAADGSPPIRCAALILIGRLGARRGDPGAVDLLREAWTIALATRECQRIGPAAAALAEAAVTAGEPDRAREAVSTAYALAHGHGTVAVRAELGYWAARVAPDAPADPRAFELEGEPYALLAAGRWSQAREVWRAAGCPFEAAFALTHSDDPDDLLTALAELDELGAEPVVTNLRGALRLRGVARIPRGPRSSTRENPAGLTARQWEVAQALATGMTNAEIAAHLVVSVRTVDTHVAAILAKLGVRNRREFVTRGAELGLWESRHRSGPEQQAPLRGHEVR